MDEWVFEHVAALFESAKHNASLDAALRQDKVVVFLHLLGLDTNGHAHRPHSKEYLDNIAYVDAGVQRVVAMCEQFFNDDKATAYVFTADHGMNDRGAHGDGDPTNTRTPLVAWGAGIRKPTPTANKQDREAVEWGLGHVTRTDVEQASLAPLMAALIGVPFPLNSVGVLPLDYLDDDAGHEGRGHFKAQYVY